MTARTRRLLGLFGLFIDEFKLFRQWNLILIETPESVMLSKLPFLFLSLLSSAIAFAQTKQVYFQQEVNYKIDVRLDDVRHHLIGAETFEYINKSPDTLTFIYVHLWPNAYRNNQTALAKQLVRNGNSKLHFAADSMRGWIDSLDFSDKKGKLIWNYDEEHIDFCKVELREPLLPGASVHISTPFVVQLPGDFSRLGHVGKSYQISQWYPKPAVYDRDGWHAMPYLDLGEFYSEFGSFEVNIELPADYRVASTGVLQNDSEKKWLEELAELNTFPRKDTILGPDKERVGKMKTITYKQDRVHDFAFFCAQNFVVRKEQAILESGVTVDAWAFFEPRKNTPWNAGAFYVKRAIESYSKWVGDYPYSAATAVEGALSAGGGMEYPMVTVISAGGDSVSLDNVITHEVGHNWFYGILGSNEREHAWMDEGFNSHVESRYMREFYPKRNSGQSFGVPPQYGKRFESHWFEYISAHFFATYGLQSAINTPSEKLTSLQYGLLSYQRTAFLLDYLTQYLGQETFDACMHRYYAEWGFKHPQPKDVQAVFEGVSGKKLDWFFNELFNTEKQPDYSLSHLRNDDKSFRVTVKNKGGVAAPYSISLVLKDSIVKTLWFEGHLEPKEIGIDRQECDYLVIDAHYLSSDLFVKSNRIKTKGLFKTAEHVKLNLITGFTRNERQNLNILPAVGWNTSDGLMLGGIFHNYDVQGKKFNYFFMPMYGIESSTLAGNFMMKYDWFVRDRSLNKVRLAAQYKRFAGYDKVEPRLDFFFETGGKEHHKNNLSLSYAWVNHRYQAFFGYTNPFSISRITYTRHRSNALVKERFSLGVRHTYAKDELDFLRFEGMYYRSQKVTRKSSLIARFYAGLNTALSGNGEVPIFSRSSPDYAKDYFMFDRARNGRAGWMGQNQALFDQGQFISSNVGIKDLLLSGHINYRYRIFMPYVSAAYAGSFYYESGLGLGLGPITFYLPITSNAFAEQVPSNGKEWTNSIHFSLNLQLSRLWNALDMISTF